MAAQSSGSKPTLWQIPISHYSEKARWALDHKAVDHVRRSPLPGMHIPVALRLTGGEHPTVPVLEIDGEAIGDSTAIIAALEERYPRRPLYPSDPEQRARALELEDFFDEELGPHIRLLVFHALMSEPETFARVAALNASGPLGEFKSFAGAYARIYTSLRWGANSEEAAETAKAQVAKSMDRLDAALTESDGEFLVGDSFSVADLTAAALFCPLVLPPEGPVPADTPTPTGVQGFREGFAERPGYRWVEETYRRHRMAARPLATL
jgi:glutathione S-transferase